MRNNDTRGEMKQDVTRCQEYLQSLSYSPSVSLSLSIYCLLSDVRLPDQTLNLVYLCAAGVNPPPHDLSVHIIRKQH